MGIDLVVSDAKAIYAPVIGSKNVMVRNTDVAYIFVIVVIMSKFQVVILFLDTFSHAIMPLETRSFYITSILGSSLPRYPEKQAYRQVIL